MSAAAQDCYAMINGLRLHYRQWGLASRPALLLLHASGCHAHWWNDVGLLLAETYHVLALDLRGHGESQHAQPPDYSFDAYVADIISFVDTLNLQRLAIIGHSMGGYIGLQYASTQPAALRALVVADMLCEMGGDMLERLHQASSRPQPTFATRDEAVQRFRLQPPETTASPDVLRALAENAVCQTPEGHWTFRFDRRAMRHTAVRVWDLLPQVICPALVVRGELSPLMPATNAEQVAQALPHGEWTTVTGAYHNLMLDNLHDFVKVVGDFLARTDLRRD